MHTYYSIIALDIANDRVRDADASRRAARLRSELPQHPGIVRRGLANGLALVSRHSTAAVRRLDHCVADDLDRALAAAK